MSEDDQVDPRPRVWLVSVAFGVPSEVWMYRQARLMRRLDLTVVTNRYQNQERFPPDGFQVRVVRGRWRLPRSQPARDLSLQLLARFNQKFRGLAMSPQETSWWLEQIEINRPDVVLAHFGTTAVEVLPLFESAGIPVVANFNGFDLSRALNRKRYRRLLEESAGRFSTYVVLADYMREALIERGVPANQIVKIPPGVPAASLSEPSRDDETTCRFLAVGRFVAKKRPDLTIRAFAEVARQNPSATLVMIGDGPLLDRCQRLAKSLGVSDRIEFLGTQPHDRVECEYARASVFVQHSETAADGDKEGWPVAIAEAAAHGLPVIATRHASIPEQIIHGEAGLLCDEGDWQTMAKHFAQLAGHANTRTEMGQAARRKMESMTVEKQVGLLEDVLLAAAAGSS